MIELDPARIAAEIDGEIVHEGGPGHPRSGAIDSREVAEGDLFFGLRGERTDGGEHAPAALRAGAWGVVVEPRRARALGDAGGGWVFAAADPLRALQRLARAWRRRLACPLVGITGSTGKTSVKDIVRALLPGRVHASAENLNTEIGLPLTILAAEPRTEILICEMAMRGPGQIAELCEIAEPDVGAITNVGPVHLELLGTMEAIVAAKAEIIAGLRPGGRAVVPVDAEALEPHLRPREGEVQTITFGPGGDVAVRSSELYEGGVAAAIATPASAAAFDLPFDQAHNLRNAECAVAIGHALGVDPAAMARRTAYISFSRLRGELVQLPAGAVLVNDCYNANPISMEAALDHLAALDHGGRRIAVLGGMAELGPEGPRYHREVAVHARRLGIGPLIGVGDLARDYDPDEWVADPESAAELVAARLGPGDAILVKGSRSVALESFAEALRARVASEESS